MPQSEAFTCVIEDKLLNDKFSATVNVVKRLPIRKSPDGKHFELADIFITPISGQHAYYESRDTWKRSPAQFFVNTKENTGSHNHFVVQNLNGCGLYIVRDSMRREIHRRQCSVWDLGQAFGIRIDKILRTFA